MTYHIECPECKAKDGRWWVSYSDCLEEVAPGIWANRIDFQCMNCYYRLTPDVSQKLADEIGFEHADGTLTDGDSLRYSPQVIGPYLMFKKEGPQR